MNFWKIIVLIIFAGALALRVYSAVSCDFAPDFSDMYDYNELAVKGGFNTYLPPVYPMFLRLVYSIFGNYNYKAVFIIQGIISSFMVILMYDIVRRVSNHIAGLIAALICSVYPNFIVYNLTTMTESLSLFIVVFLTWLLLIPFNPRYKAFTIAVVLAVGILMKSAMLFFIPGTLLISKKRIMLLLILLAIISPWIIRNAVIGNKLAPVSDTGALNFYASYNPAATGSKHVAAEETPLKTYDHKQMVYVREALKFIINNKWKTLDIMYNKLSILLSKGWDTFVMKKIVGNNPTWNNIMLYAYLPVFILGFIGLVRRYDEQNRVIAIQMFSYLFFAILFAIFKLRYRVLVEPMLIMYASILIGSKCKNFTSEKLKSS